MYRVLLSPPDTGVLEITYVREAMESGWVAPAGPDLAAFEDEMAARVGVGHAVGLVLRHRRAAPGPGLVGRRSR